MKLIHILFAETHEGEFGSFIIEHYYSRYKEESPTHMHALNDNHQ